MLLPEIDEKKTRNNVIELFEQYDSLCRLAGEQYEQKLTADYNLEPKGDGGISRPVENMVTRKIAAKQILVNLYQALNRLDIEQRAMLWNHYILKNVTEYVIQTEYHLTPPAYYARLKKAQLAFAEVYNIGELIVEITT